jgi:hypothetical protein
MSKHETPLLRCTVCRHRYRPSLTAATFQKTCSDSCRLRRRRRLARARRERNLQDYRVDERERQRASRRRWKKKKPGDFPPETTDSVDVSRTGLQPQVADLQTFVRESVDKALERSRPTLIRQLTAFLADNQANRGHVFPPDLAGHAPA